jgi:hypothetical protein
MLILSDRETADNSVSQLGNLNGQSARCSVSFGLVMYAGRIIANGAYGSI